MKKPNRKPLSRRAFRQVCLYSQICFVRNIAGEKFPNALSPEERIRLGAHLAAVLCATFDFEDMTHAPELRGIAGDLYNLLPESERDAGYHLLQRGESVFCEIMATNHLTFTVRTTEQELTEQAESVEQFVAEIGKILPYATHERYGFLTAQLPLLGSGFRVRSILHLCGLSHFNWLRELCNAAEFDGVLVELDSPEPPPGHLITLFNRFALGRSVRTIAQAYSRTLSEVVRQELHARQRLLCDEPFVLLDTMTRSRAIIESAFLLAEHEALDALSNVRLAASLGILKPDRNRSAGSADWYIWPLNSLIQAKIERGTAAVETLPPQVADYPPWRIDALRAKLMFVSTAIELKEDFVTRALHQ